MAHLSPQTLTTDELHALLQVSAAHPRDHIILSLALGTGLRLSELVGLNVGDLFFPTGQPRQRVRVRAEIAKGGRAGDVFLPDALVPKLVAFWRHKAERRRVWIPWRRRSAGRLVVGRIHGAYRSSLTTGRSKRDRRSAAVARSAVVPACDQGPIEKTRLRACERAGGVVLLDASRWIVRGRGEAQEVLVRDADAVVLRFCYRQPNLSNTHNAFRFAAGSMSGDISARGAFTAIG